ncbi:MAG: hypothetical protein U0841_25435 [Chloroflexia bacterium]
MTTQIQGYLRALAARRQLSERVGPFLAGYDAHSDLVYRNYRDPDDEGGADAGGGAGLDRGFERRRRTRRAYMCRWRPRRWRGR